MESRPGYEEKALDFECQGSRLYGVLSLPAMPAARGVLLVVGGPQYRAGSHRQFTLLARYLAGRGIPVLRFDYRGMGDSEGEARGFEAVDQDLRAAADCFLGAVPALREIVLWGLCDAASAALFYAHQDARVSGLVLLNPWVRTGAGEARAYLKHYYLARLLDPAFWRKLAGGGFDFRASWRGFCGLLRRARRPPAEAASSRPLPERMLDGLQRFRGRVLLICSGKDLTAREFCDLVAGSRPWRAALRHAERRELAAADHTFSSREWRDQVALWTADWVQAGASRERR